MLENLFSDITLSAFLFLAMACFFAAFIDAIAGGGGLISVPAFLAVGLDPHLALGTNKLAASFSTVGSAFKFAHSGKVDWKMVKYMMPFSFVGAILGVKAVVAIDSKYLYPISFAFLVFVLLYTLKNKKLGEKDEFTGLTDKNLKIGALMAFILGFYDGFFGPGTGSFIIFGLIKIYKLDFIKASGNAKFLNLASNISSVITFIYYRKISYFYAISIGILMLFGAAFGAKCAVSKGSKFIRPVFLVVTSIVTIKMLVTFIGQL